MRIGLGVFGLVLLLGAPLALADAAEDCNQPMDPELRLEACSRLLEDGRQSAEDLARTYRNRGGAFLALGRDQQAIADFTESIRLKPDYALAFAGRGQAKLAMAELDAAITDYGEAIKLNPNYSSAYISRGYAFLVKGDLDRAVADFGAALMLAPANVVALNNRGLAYRRKGEFELALKDYDAALNLNPAYALAFNNRGYVHEALGQKKEATEDFHKALSLDPSLVGARDGLKRIGADPSLAAETDRLVVEGRALVQNFCSECHAIELRGESPNPKAPAFRNLQNDYPILALREPLSRGIARPHDVMPHFILSDAQIDTIVAYINSLTPEK